MSLSSRFPTISTRKPSPPPRARARRFSAPSRSVAPPPRPSACSKPWRKQAFLRDISRISATRPRHSSRSSRCAPARWAMFCGCAHARRIPARTARGSGMRSRRAADASLTSVATASRSFATSLAKAIAPSRCSAGRTRLFIRSAPRTTPSRSSALSRARWGSSKFRGLSVAAWICATRSRARAAPFG